MASSSSTGMALKTFSLANDVLQVSPQDEIIKFDHAANQKIMNEEPWKKDPHYFKSCKISAMALVKMVIHARSGGMYEIMGLLQGKVMGNTIVVMDSFALPVQGTETRVNASNEANEYIVEYLEDSRKAQRKENAIGWYHSHPGYGCWLSGIDVNTQMTNQSYQDPWLALVIDPNRTISAGKVDIGAFRTYPENYTAPNSGGGGGGEYQSIPLSKIEDFGVHANQYYQLELEIFTSSLDEEVLGLLWNKYWVNTLSQSSLISNREYAVSQLTDLHQKLAKAESAVAGTKATLPNLKDLNAKGKEGDNGGNTKQSGEKKKDSENQLAKSVKDSTKIAIEAQHGLIAQVIKDVIFSMRPRTTHPGSDAVTESGTGSNTNAARPVRDAVDSSMRMTLS